MKKLLRQIMLVLFIALGPQPALAKDDFTTPIVTRLEEEGFVVTRIKRTWLGRILIVSQNGEYLREVVINPHTGEILRDKLFALDGSNAAAAPMGDMQGMSDEMRENHSGGSENMGGNMGGSPGGGMGGKSGGGMGGGN